MKDKEKVEVGEKSKKREIIIYVTAFVLILGILLSITLFGSRKEEDKKPNKKKDEIVQPEKPDEKEDSDNVVVDNKDTVSYVASKPSNNENKGENGGQVEVPEEVINETVTKPSNNLMYADIQDGVIYVDGISKYDKVNNKNKVLFNVYLKENANLDEFSVTFGGNTYGSEILDRDAEGKYYFEYSGYIEEENETLVINYGEEIEEYEVDTYLVFKTNPVSEDAEVNSSIAVEEDATYDFELYEIETEPEEVVSQTAATESNEEPVVETTTEGVEGTVEENKDKSYVVDFQGEVKYTTSEEAAELGLDYNYIIATKLYAPEDIDEETLRSAIFTLYNGSEVTEENGLDIFTKDENGAYYKDIYKDATSTDAFGFTIDFDGENTNYGTTTYVYDTTDVTLEEKPEESTTEPIEETEGNEEEVIA